MKPSDFFSDLFLPTVSYLEAIANRSETNLMPNYSNRLSLRFFFHCGFERYTFCFSLHTRAVCEASWGLCDVTSAYCEVKNVKGCSL